MQFPFGAGVFLVFLAVCHAQNGVIHYPQEKHLKNVRQLTFGGEMGEAYFSFDNKQLIFQSSGAYGDKCDQIYRMDLEGPCALQPRRVSTGLGLTTCSYFLPDNERTLYASTHRTLRYCPGKRCESEEARQNKTLWDLCHQAPYNYTWDLVPDFDIYVTNKYGHILYQLTNNSVYDAEATVSPDGKRIVYTSMESGDPELYTCNLDGTDVKMVTNYTGYDGGAYFSPDSKKLVFRASRPNSTHDKWLYESLLDWNIVSPIQMEIFTCNADGTDLKQVTNLGAANWAPFWHPSGEKIIFASNHDTENFGFSLFMIDADGSNLEKITYDPKFDAFAMFSFDGKYLVWESYRNASTQDEFNIFIAEWVENPGKSAHKTASTSVWCLFSVLLSLFVAVYSC